MEAQGLGFVPAAGRTGSEERVQLPVGARAVPFLCNLSLSELTFPEATSGQVSLFQLQDLEKTLAVENQPPDV